MIEQSNKQLNIHGVISLLAKLKEEGIGIRVVNGQLKVNAAKGTLNPQLINQLKDKKDEIINFLQKTGDIRVKHFLIQPLEKKEYYRLSPAQMRLYVLKEIYPEASVYNISQVVELERAMDRKRLEDTIRKLIARHESLRTSFDVVDEEPVQRVHDKVDFEIEYYDTGTVNNGQKLQETDNRGRLPKEAEIVNNFIKPFHLKNAPLLRVGVIEPGQGRQILMVDMHHIISDEVSHRILYRDFMALYAGKELPPLKIQYKDYSQWQNRELKKAKIKKQENYWLNQFKGKIPIINLPIDYPRPPVYSIEGSSLGFKIGEQETSALKKIAKDENCSMFMVLVTLFNILLSKISGQSDIVVGTPIAGRTHSDLEPIIGIFVNLLALRNFPEKHKSFIQFLREVKNRTLSAFENQDFQVDDLIDVLKLKRELYRNPLFNIVISITNLEESPGETPGNETPTAIDGQYNYEHNTAKYDLVLLGSILWDRLSFVLVYNTKLFKKETIERIATYFKQVVSSVVLDRNKEISSIAIITDEQRNRLIKRLSEKKGIPFSTNAKEEEPQESVEMAAEFDY